MFTAEYDGRTLYDPRDESLAVLDQACTLSLTEAGSYTFTLPKVHPMAGTLEVMARAHEVVLYDDGEEVFRGRVRCVDSQDIENSWAYECEGERAYLNDVTLRPYECGTSGVPTSADGMFAWYVGEYNERVPEADRFHVGLNEGWRLHPAEDLALSNDSRPSVWDELKSNLVDVYGGYVRVRRVGSERFIDWLADGTRECAQRVEFGENLTDYAYAEDGTELFTRIVPWATRSDPESVDAGGELGDGSTPAIAMQPVSIWRAPGGEASFKVRLSGGEDGAEATYQWQTRDAAGTAWADCGDADGSGWDSATLTVQVTEALSGRAYRCTATVGGTALTSEAATLSVSEHPGWFGLELLADSGLLEGYEKCGDAIVDIEGEAARGTVERAVQYDVATAEELQAAALQDLRNSRIATSLEISAVDLHRIDPSVERIALGDFVRVTSEPHGYDGYMLCTEIDLDPTDATSTYRLGATYDTLTGAQSERLAKLTAKLTEQTAEAKATSEQAKAAAEKAQEALTKLADLHGTFVHIRYSESADGSNMTETPTALTQYIGIVSDSTEADPADPAAYSWSLIKGADGVKGETGEDGASSYLHVKWSDDGKSFTADSGETVGDWMGTCVTQSEADPTDFAMYTWVKVKGERGPQGLQGLQGEKGDQGIQGVKGADGASSYTHVAYANSEDGSTDFSVSDPDRDYIGVCVDSSSADPTTPASYRWTRVKGEDGPQGIPGAAGADGKTPYLHIAYATSADGKTGFSVSDSTGKTYIGQCTDYDEADPTTPASYSWTLIKGDKGDKGDTGAAGVGYRANLLHNSAFIADKSSWNNWGTPATLDFVEYANEKKWAHVVNTGTNRWQGLRQYVSLESMLIEPVTVSVRAKGGANGQLFSLRCHFIDNGTVVKDLYYNQTIDTDETVVTHTFKTTKEYSGIRLMVGIDDKTAVHEVYFTEVMLVLGDQPAEWSYAASELVGADGNGIKSVTNYYLATASASGVTTSTSGWTTSVQSVSASKKYLWNYEVIAYTDGTSATSTPCVIGAYGDTGATGATGPQGPQGEQGVKGDTGATGNGIESAAVTYAAASDGVTPPSSWQSSIPTVAAGQYLWTRTVTTYTDGTSSTAYSVGMKGATGATGAKGDKGDTGATGADGKGVKSAAVTYQASSSGTTTPTGTWSTSVPSVGAGQYLWTRTVTTYTDSTTVTAYSVARTGTNGTNGTNGKDGTSVTVKSQAVTYQASTSGTTTPTGTWSSSVPSVSAGGYLWTRTVVTYSDGTSTTAYSVARSGTNGTNGTNGTDGKDGADGKMLLGTCTTAAATAAKTVSITGFSLYTGVTVAVQFQYANTAASPTLNVNSTGAKAIYTNGINAAYWTGSYATVVLTYDGSAWRVCSQPVYASTATVGNPSSGNVYIDSAGVEVRDGSTVLSSFGADTVELGKNSTSSVVKMCGGAAKVYTYEGDDVYLLGERAAILQCVDEGSDGTIGIAKLSQGVTARAVAEYYEVAGVTNYTTTMSGRVGVPWVTCMPQLDTNMTKTEAIIPVGPIEYGGAGLDGKTMFGFTTDGGVKVNFSGCVLVSGRVFFSMDAARSDNPVATIYHGSESVCIINCLVPNAWGIGGTAPLMPVNVTNGDVLYLKAYNATAARGYVNQLNTRLAFIRLY